MLITPSMFNKMNADKITSGGEKRQSNPMMWVQHNGVWKGSNNQPVDPRKKAKKKRKQRRKNKQRSRK